MKAQNDLGRDSIAGLVCRFAVPGLLAQLVCVLYSIVDRIYIGHIAGAPATALAGVGVCGPVVTMVGSVAYLVGTGGAPLASIKLGEGDHKGAQQIMANCFLLLVVCAAGLTALLIPLRRPMLMLFGASEATYPYAGAYFTVYIAGTIFALLSVGLNQFIVCQGFAKEGMIAIAMGAALNITLDPLFLFAFDMGVRGAAFATVLSQMGSVIYVLYFLTRRAPIKLVLGGYRARIMGKVLMVGFTPFIIIAMDNIMLIAVNAMLKRTGGTQGDLLITVSTIAQSFMLLITMPMGGISMGTGAILGYNYGARRADRVKTAQKYIILWCVGYASLWFVLARVGGGLFVRLFTDNTEIAAQAVWAIRVMTLAVIPLGLQYELVDGFTGMGQVQLALPLSAWRKLVYFVCVFGLPLYFGARAVFYAEPISDILGPLGSVIVYRSTIDRVLHKQEKAPPYEVTPKS